MKQILRSSEMKLKSNLNVKCRLNQRIEKNDEDSFLIQFICVKFITYINLFGHICSRY